MCTDFTADIIWMNTKCAVSLGLISATEHLKVNFAKVHPYNIYGEASAYYYVFMSNKVSKSYLMANSAFINLCILVVFRYIFFGFHHKQCASDQKYFTDESLKDETHLLLL